MTKAILFDAYGTLISTGDGSVQAARVILQRAGRLDIDPKAFYARWKQLHRKHMEALAVFVTEEELFRRDLQALYAEYGIAGRPRQEVQPMLDTLGNRTAFSESQQVLEQLAGRYTLCIASTTDTEPLLQDLRRSGLRVHHVFTSEGLRAYKPSAAFYQAILDRLNLLPEEALFVGDSLVDDVQGPQAVGISACWLNRKGVGLPEGAHPRQTLSNLLELCDFLEKISK